MNKEKKQLTPTQQKKKYKKIKRICFAGEFASVITPFVIIGIVNFNKYFVEYDGTKMSIACGLAFALMGLALWLVASKKFNNSFVTLIVGWAVVDFIFWMIGQVIMDIAMIMFFGLIGLLGAYGLDIASAQADKKLQKVTDAINQAEKDMTVEAYKEEKIEEAEKKKVKIKIKK